MSGATRARAANIYGPRAKRLVYLLVLAVDECCVLRNGENAARDEIEKRRLQPD